MRHTNQHANTTVIRVWDLPTRVFHWLTAGSFAVAWLTHEQDRNLDLHVFSGYLFLGLLLFRLLWGAIGSHYARFGSFAFGWPALRTYLQGLRRGRAEQYMGHNPAGSWAIFLMLALGLGISFTGLLVFGVEERQGPFAGWLPFAFADGLHESHATLAWIMLFTVFVHITGVLVESRLHRVNLVAAMISGYRHGRPDSISVASRGIIGGLLLVVAAGSAFGYFSGYLTESAEQPYRPYRGAALADHAGWREACGECHLAYHPSLLPARSWQRLLATQDDHFGDDLALDTETLAEIEAFLTANAAEQQATEAAWKIGRSIAANAIPLRISDTPYWQHKHEDIAPRYWEAPLSGGKSDCAACHLDAVEGTFEDAAMRLPPVTPNPKEIP